MELFINDRIRTRKINFFNEFRASLKYDSTHSTFGFKFYFNPENIEHKEMACIGHYHLCTIKHNNETLLTGQIISEVFNSESSRQLVTIGGYSLPGILEDCEIMTGDPVTSELSALSRQWKEFIPQAEADAMAVSLQTDGLTFKEIVQKAIAPFGLSMVIDPIVSARMEEQFDETEARISQNIKSYLTELATQKNITISHNEKGQLVFTQAPAFQKAIFHFDKTLPGINMGLSFNGQGMHSHIKVVAQADIDDLNSVDNMKRNPYVINTVFRPKVIVQSSRGRGGSGDDDTKLAAKNALAQELKNIELNIKIDRWILNGKIVRPGKLISVTNPEIYLYKKTNWLIEEVELTNDSKKETANLKCVLPECYNGQPAQYIWEGINLH